MIKEAWENANLNRVGMACHKLGRCLKDTATALKVWNCSHFGRVDFKIKSLEEDLLRLQEEDGDTRARQIGLSEELRV